MVSRASEYCPLKAILRDLPDRKYMITVKDSPRDSIVSKFM